MFCFTSWALLILSLTLSNTYCQDVGSGFDINLGNKNSTISVCGTKNPNKNFIDLTEPKVPGPFDDLTVSELENLRLFLEADPYIKAVDPTKAQLNSSHIYTADVLLPPKKEVLDFLDKPGSPRPVRRARVVLFRGDKTPPVVEEYVCSPLPDIKKCELMNYPYRKNPVEYQFRPMIGQDYAAIEKIYLAEIDRKVGFILKESYGETFTECGDGTQQKCLNFVLSYVGSGLTSNPKKRLSWISAAYNLNYITVHILDFAFLLESSSPNPDNWSIVKLWYGDRIFQDCNELIDSYNGGLINKTKVTKPVDDNKLYSSLKQRGEFVPPKPQRPPTLVEPDGKRYSVKGKKVDYLGWSFNFRSSSFTGPSLYNIKFKGKRIAYELGLSEIAVFYSGHGPFGQTTNYVDSGELLGSWSRSLVPGGDCPEHATLIPATWMSHEKRKPDVYKAAYCLFEHNNGHPLRRHSSYAFGEGSFYGGLLNYALILRSAITIGNYDYIVDFIFNHNGVIEARLMSTGYIQTVYYTKFEKPYGFQIYENGLGNIHHHIAHFKADIDIEGTSNRYETLDIVEEKVNMTAFPDRLYSQTSYRRYLKSSELDAVFNYNFEKPKYLVVHNNDVKTKFGEFKGFRIQINGMSKNLVAENEGNEKTVPWARHQMVVTKQKDHEISSSSIYGMYDSSDPTVNFTSFYGDNESIVDEDLVFWITQGMHHIPHTEDIPVTPTVGNHLSFFLLPYNYFPECPSMGSRDSIYIEHRNRDKPELGVKVERYGQTGDQCITPKSTLDKDVAADPDRVLQTFS